MKINTAKSVVASSKLEGMRKEEFISQESHIQQITASLLHPVKDHTTNEEVILKINVAGEISARANRRS